jgi:hypothetical protein
MAQVSGGLATPVFPVFRRARESQDQQDSAGIHLSDQFESMVAHMSHKFPRLEAQLSHFESNAFAFPAQSQLTPSVFDRDDVAPDRHLQDRRPYRPLPFSTIRGIIFQLPAIFFRSKTITL